MDEMLPLENHHLYRELLFCWSYYNYNNNDDDALWATFCRHTHTNYNNALDFIRMPV